MRILAAATAAIFLAAGAAYAQPAGAPPPPPAPPHVYQAAGYSQPDITPGLCRNISPQQTQCVIPQMTAGRYLIEAQGTSTANGAGATQSLVIALGQTPCTEARSVNSGANARPWTSGPQTIKLSCIVQVVTDDVLQINALYVDSNATKDPRGPLLSLRRLPWNAYLSATPAGGGTSQPEAGR